MQSLPWDHAQWFVYASSLSTYTPFSMCRTIVKNQIEMPAMQYEDQRGQADVL